MNDTPERTHNMTTYYFAADGSYGDADTLIIVDTADWTEEDWDHIEFARDRDRAEIAASIASHAAADKPQN